MGSETEHAARKQRASAAGINPSGRSQTRMRTYLFVAGLGGGAVTAGVAGLGAGADAAGGTAEFEVAAGAAELEAAGAPSGVIM